MFYFPSPHSVISKSFFNIFMFVLLLFLVFIIAFTVVFFFSLLFQTCMLVYLRDFFPVVVSSILFLLTFFVQRSPFSITFRMGLLLLYSFSFCLLEKFFISPSILNYILAGQNILGCKFFPFSTLNIFCHSLLAYSVSVEKSADSLMGVPL